MTAQPKTPAVFNHFAVPLRMWRMWNDAQRATFNRLYAHINANQRIFAHPKAPKLLAEHWNTTAWNMAWTAAEAIDDTGLRFGDEVHDLTSRGRVVRRVLVAA